MTSAPPHPGAAWQQCQDQSTGYPYYWNTVTNEVRVWLSSCLVK